MLNEKPPANGRYTPSYTDDHEVLIEKTTSYYVHPDPRIPIGQRRIIPIGWTFDFLTGEYASKPKP